ncbi:MAG: CapA family protein [Bacteroidota bacterium]|nr:CapA family protein [Bacteroidota bacterium]
MSFCKLLGLFKRKAWSKPLIFEENPRTMTFKELIYFTYKYYYAPSIEPSNHEVRQHFNLKTSKPTDFKTELSISIGGDLMPYELITKDLTKNLWDEIGEDFFSSDIVFANLETPLDIQQPASFVPEVMLNNMLFNANEEMFEIFNGNQKYKGFDILSLANNHTLDMGVIGIQNTMDFIQKKNIAYIGTQKNEDDKSWKIINVKGYKIGFVAFTYSLNQFTVPENEPCIVNLLDLNVEGVDVANIKNEVLACKQEGADFIICSLHCGNAYQAYPSPTAIDLFQRVFNECGVDVIAGGHPHNPQPSRYYDFIDPYTGEEKRGFAIYSLGDFVAYDIFTWCHLSAYLKINIGKNHTGKIVFSVKVNHQYMEKSKNGLQFRTIINKLNESVLNKEFLDIKPLFEVL